MGKLLSLSSFLLFVIIVAFQTGFSSCTKDITMYDTITITNVDTLTQHDTLVIQDTIVTMSLLTANAWKTQSIRGVIGNQITYYERGLGGYTENYDDEYIHFNADGTGNLLDAAYTDHPITWAFANGTTAKLTFIVLNPAPIADQTVNWENLRFKNGMLMYDQYWTYTGVNAHTQAVRIPK